MDQDHCRENILSEVEDSKESSIIATQSNDGNQLYAHPDFEIEFKDLFDQRLYFNRELSWLDFNWRVLNEALDESVPILERLNFIAIASSNLDEFFMIRVAGLRQQLDLGVPDVPPDGMSPDDTLSRIHEIVSRMMKTMSDCFINIITPELEKEGVRIHSYGELDEMARKWCERYFFEHVFPVLTPLAIDPGHPFPHLLNRSLNLLLKIIDTSTKEEKVAVVQVPPVLPRLVEIPVHKRGNHYVLLGEIIAANGSALFPGLNVRDWYRFRVTRDADLEIVDDEAADLLKTIEEQVRRRRWGAVVRVEVDSRMPAKLRKQLMKAMRLTNRDIYLVDGPINLADYSELTVLKRKNCKYQPFIPRIVEQLRGGENIFKTLSGQDLFLHHPYDSYSSVLEFIETASDDPKVLAIKQTLYRTGGESGIVKALARAAENGKQVTVFVELKARFDEENNISWARALEQAGVHVVYGILGLKTHCKLAIVVRKEKKCLRTYVHMSTGNYNEFTSRIYTDFGLMTSREEVGYEASSLFNYLTGYSNQTDWKKIIISPVSLRQKLLALIQREIDMHSEENPGRIVAKLNALVDGQIIRALYRASQAGVSIDLIIRGICCLRPGVPGISENIRVRSIIGRFLEHSRVLTFHNGGNTEVYLSSADWMPRNLDRRVEMIIIVEDETVKNRLVNTILPIILADNRKAYLLNSDGIYRKALIGPNDSEMNSQEYFIGLSEAAYKEQKEG